MEKVDIIEAVEDAAAEHGLEFRIGYGGRGMFGAECIAVDYDSLDDYANFWASLDPEVRKALGHTSTDSMGLGQVAYWRGVQTRMARF